MVEEYFINVNVKVYNEGIGNVFRKVVELG